MMVQIEDEILELHAWLAGTWGIRQSRRVKELRNEVNAVPDKGTNRDWESESRYVGE